MTLPSSVINTVAGALALAVAGATVSLQVHDATQDERIKRIEGLDNKMDGLSSDLQQLNGKLDQLNGRIEGQRDILISPRASRNLRRI